MVPAVDVRVEEVPGGQVGRAIDFAVARGVHIQPRLLQSRDCQVFGAWIAAIRLMETMLRRPPTTVSLLM